MAGRPLRSAAVASAVAVLSLTTVMAPAGAEAPRSSYIVMLEPATRTASQARASAIRTANESGVDPDHVYANALEGFSATMTDSEAADLASDPAVVAVVPDGPVRIQDACTKPITAPCEPTGVLRIGGAGGGTDPDVSSTNVAVIDTGVDTDHPDLNVVGGESCINSPSFDDANGHGTHVAGTLAGTGASGVTGVAPGAPIWSVRVLGATGGGSWSNVVCGLDWVAGTRLDADPTNDIDVVNMSLGGGGFDDGDCGLTKPDPVHQAICATTDLGVLSVVAAGNSSRALSNEKPASFDEVLTVTAVSDYDGAPGSLGGPRCARGHGADDTAARFSDYAQRGDRKHTVAAPGVCILSSWKERGYKTLSGTSMASPHVAGTAVLCLASGACPTDDPLETLRQLRADAKAQAAINTDQGFKGDPVHRIKGKYYGYLVDASAY